MGTNFTSSSYLTAFRDRNRDVYTSVEIARSVRREGLQFEYGNVTYWAYAYRYYSSLDLPCFLQPVFAVAALPLAAWCAVAQTVYHLALVLIDGLSTLLCMPPPVDFCTYMQARVFYVIRDFEEAFGWLLTIFDERLGFYYVDEADFQKSCYDCILLDEKVVDPEGYAIRQVENYLVQRNRVKALELANEGGNWEFRDKLFEKIVEFDLAEGHLGFALLATQAMGYMLYDKKQQLYEKIALAYLAADDQDSALRVVSYISHPDKKFSAYEKMVSACCKANKPDQALVILQSDGLVTLSFHMRNSLREQVAGCYFDQGDLDKALEVIKMVQHDRKKQDVFTAKVVKELLNRRENERAILLIEGLEDAKAKAPLFVKVALSYYAILNYGKVKALLQKMLKAAFQEEMTAAYQFWDYNRVVNSNPAGVDNLFSELVEEYFRRFDSAFSEQDEEEVLGIISEIARKQSTKDAFSRLYIDPYADKKGSRNFGFDDEEFFRGFFNGFFNGGFGGSRSYSQTPPAPPPVVSNDAYFKVLGLPTTATKADVRRVYKTYAITSHPDKVQTQGKQTGETDEAFKSRVDAAMEKFKEVSNAHDKLVAYFDAQPKT